MTNLRMKYILVIMYNAHLKNKKNDSFMPALSGQFPHIVDSTNALQESS